MRKLVALLIILLAQCLFSPCFAIKIGLQTGLERTYIGSTTQAQVISAHTNKLLYTMSEMKAYEFRAYKKSIAI